MKNCPKRDVCKFYKNKKVCNKTCDIYLCLMRKDEEFYPFENDITKCKGTGCPLKKTCVRFTSREAVLQSYFCTVPYDKKKCKCKEHME